MQKDPGDICRHCAKDRPGIQVDRRKVPQLLLPVQEAFYGKKSGKWRDGFGKPDHAGGNERDGGTYEKLLKSDGLRDCGGMEMVCRHLYLWAEMDVERSVADVWPVLCMHNDGCFDGSGSDTGFHMSGISV